ncbi:hypothetical protein SAMN05443665_1007141 [Actinomadura meyerae]|jgi:hypothetical protein|uniref:Uncharacterized protein n=1 Tax=Actinomadura meyerae TaxID=240840 RepID=A0A239GG88_9ACTN|nr:hypothetical protein [Actinomadura meyerae]SNS67084.1 hypothetical protein SAMN05443665_1007141 [Actinomadura meyerae]
MKALLNSLNEPETALVRETETAELTRLDEDGLADLHTRIRRARDKYSKQYRRTASARVEQYGGRGKARPKNRRNAQKAEVFEDALARVSWYLARAARRSAAELKAERIAAATASGTPPPRPGAPAPETMTAQTTRRRRPTSADPALNRRHAATRAKGARRQARRDAR